MVSQRLICIQILVLDNLLTEAEKQWAPADDPIFKLVPPAFQEIVAQCYIMMLS